MEKPSLYLDQVAAELFDRTGYSTSVSHIFKLLKSKGYTLKKMELHVRSASKLEQQIFDLLMKYIHFQTKRELKKKKDRNRFVFGHRLRPIKNNNKPKERKKFVLTKKSYIHNNKPVGGKHSNDELMTQNRKKKQRELDRQKRVKLKEERLQERISLEFDKVQEEQRHIVNDFKRSEN